MFKGGRRLPRIKYCGDTEDNLWQASKKREGEKDGRSLLPPWPAPKAIWAPSRSKRRPPSRMEGLWCMTTCHMWHSCPTGVFFFFFFFKFSHFNFPPSSHNHLDLQSNKDDSVGLEDECADSFHTRMREDSPPDEQGGHFAKIYIFMWDCFHFYVSSLCFRKKCFYSLSVFEKLK